MLKIKLLTIMILLTSISASMAQEVDVNGNTVDTGLFDFGNFTENTGLLSILGVVSSLIFSFLLVAWIFIAIFAGIKIISSQGNPEGIQGGTKRIQNMLMGITIGILFFIAVSVLGWFAGVGNIYEWSESFKECECAGGADTCYHYRFQAESAYEVAGDELECVEGAGWQQ